MNEEIDKLLSEMSSACDKMQATFDAQYKELQVDGKVVMRPWSWIGHELYHEKFAINYCIKKLRKILESH